MYENEIYIHEDVSAQIYDAAIRANYRGRIDNPPVVETYSVVSVDFGHNGEHEVIIYDPQTASRCRAIFYEDDNRWEYYTVEEDEYFVAWSVEALAHLINSEHADAA